MADESRCTGIRTPNVNSLSQTKSFKPIRTPACSARSLRSGLTQTPAGGDHSKSATTAPIVCAHPFMNASDSLVSASRTLRALRLHPQHDSSSDRNQQQQQQYHQRLPPPPKPSLRRILEKRGLLPLRRVDDTPVATGTGAGVSRASDAAHLPLPNLRFATRAFRASTDDPPDQYDTSRGGRHSIDECTRRISDSGHDESYTSLQWQHAYQTVHENLSLPLPLTLRSQGSGGRSHSTAVITSHSGCRAMTPEERRIARTCVVEGCANYIVDRHRCFRHGVSANSVLVHT